LGNGDATALADACFTASTGRVHRRHRLAVVASDAHEASSLLSSLDSEGSTVARGVADGGDPEVAFLFTGQGAQYPGMGRTLFESQPVFRQALEECDALFRPHLPVPLFDVLYGDGAAERPLVHETQ